MNAVATERKTRRRRNQPTTVYGSFLDWVMFRYDLRQEDLAKIMGVSQSTVSNSQIGRYEASWRGATQMADELGFDRELRHLLGLVFTYGQGTPAPAEKPPDFPYSLARELDVEEDDSSEATEENGGGAERFVTEEQRRSGERERTDRNGSL